MTTQVTDVDELEAILAGLEGETSTPVIDDDVSDAVLVEEPTAPVAEKKPRAPRRLKDLPPVIDHDAVAKAALDNELGDLDDLGDLDEPNAPLDAATTPGVELDDLSDLDDLDEPAVAPGGAALASDAVLNQDDVQKDVEHLGVATADEVLAESRANDSELDDLGLDEPLDEPVAASQPVPVEDDIDALLGEVALTEPVTEAPEPIAIAAAPSAAATAAPAVGKTGSGSSKGSVSIAPTFNPTGSLKTFLDMDKLDSDLNFTATNISMAMTRQAALFAHYSNLAAQATYQADRAKQQVKLVEANLDQMFRDSLMTAGTKFTEKVIETMIAKDSTYQDAQTRAHEAKAIASMVEAAADSFRHKKDMLIQMGADLRQEKSGNPIVREHPGQAALHAMERPQ